MSKVIKNASKNIRRSPYQALAAVAVLTITFFIAQIFALLVLGSDQVLKYFETRPQVSAFFTDATTIDQINAVKSELELKTYVASVKYISKEEALAIYREQNQDDPLLLEMVTSDILPASLEVSATKVEYLPQIKTELESSSLVEDVIYQQDVVESLTRWTNNIRLAGIVLVGFLFATSMLIVIIIVNMKIASRRHEIAIMRLLGADSWFIRGPFLAEGSFYGVLSGFISWGVTYLSLLYATPFLVEFLGDIPLLPVSPLVMLAVLATTVFSGVFIGGIGSTIAVRRFFK